MKLHRIEIDIAGEDGYEERTREWAKKFRCKANVITHNGPAGENPLYEIVGTKEDLRQLFTDYDGQAYLGWKEETRKEAVEEDVEELFRPEPYVEP